MGNSILRYRTFDQVFNEISSDWSMYALENMINPQDLMKVAKRVNYDLGLRIQRTEEAVLEVDKGRVKLPDNFNVLNFAMICEEMELVQQMPQGTNIQDIKVFPKYQETNANIDLCTPSVVNCNPTAVACTCGGSCNCSGSCSCGCTNCQNPAFNKICETPVVQTNEVNTSNTQTDTQTDTTPISQCSWTFSTKLITFWYSMVINGQMYNLSPVAGGIDQAVHEANTLGLGTFNYINAGSIIMYVIGTETYGSLFISDQMNPAVEVLSSCTVVGSNVNTTTTVTITDTTDTTVNTTTNCCAVNPDPCSKPRVVLNCKGEIWEVVQVVNPAHTEHFRRIRPLRLQQNAESIDCGCPNLYIQSSDHGWIKDNYLYTSFTCGKVYINYQATMVDNDNNIIIPDHDGLNDYYEYALKQRVLENLMMNDEPIGQKLQLIEVRLKAARNYALTIVNTPNFAEMKQIWQANRRAQYAKYYDMFKSYTWYQWDRNPNLDMMMNPSR